jgi:hypothetical protein
MSTTPEPSLPSGADGTTNEPVSDLRVVPSAPDGRLGSGVVLIEQLFVLFLLKRKLLDEHYTRAKSSIWGGWYDSEIRDWLVSHGYLKSDAQGVIDTVRSELSSETRIGPGQVRGSGGLLVLVRDEVDELRSV